MSQHDDAKHSSNTEPNPMGQLGQLDPSVRSGSGYVIYRMLDAATNRAVAQVLVTNTTVALGFQPSMEYWKPVSATAFNTDELAGGLSVQRTEHAWTETPPFPSTDTHVFKQPVYQQWLVVTHTHLFQTVTDATGAVQYGFRVQATFGSSWQGTVQWLRFSTNGLFALNGLTQRRDMTNVTTASCSGGLL
jgi:hypothetical protein